jgi:hypothetical protein
VAGVAGAHGERKDPRVGLASIRVTRFDCMILVIVIYAKIAAATPTGVDE